MGSVTFCHCFETCSVILLPNECVKRANDVQILRHVLACLGCVAAEGRVQTLNLGVHNGGSRMVKFPYISHHIPLYPYLILFVNICIYLYCFVFFCCKMLTCQLKKMAKAHLHSAKR